MYSIQIKNRAKVLRKGGRSIYTIARILGLKPTTVSYWCKDIKEVMARWGSQIVV
jgi:DNA-binding transcriptional regulator YdaS (Cro superfamily)